MIDRTISALKLGIQILPNLLALVRIIPHNANRPHLQILPLRIIAMIIQILILINRIGMNNPRLITLPMICAGVVYHETLEIEC
jgi:hypothetical protein